MRGARMETTASQTVETTANPMHGVRMAMVKVMAGEMVVNPMDKPMVGEITVGQMETTVKEMPGEMVVNPMDKPMVGEITVGQMETAVKEMDGEMVVNPMDKPMVGEITTGIKTGVMIMLKHDQILITTAAR